MAKTTFGELIDSKAPTVICFYNNNSVSETDKAIHHLKALADKFDGKISVIKLDILKNEELATALRVKETPSIVIYQESEMRYRSVTLESNMPRLEKLITRYLKDS